MCKTKKNYFPLKISFVYTAAYTSEKIKHQLSFRETPLLEIKKINKVLGVNQDLISKYLPKFS